MSKLIRLAIPGMKCGACATTVEDALNAETGVVRTEVDLETKTARVDADVPPSVLIDTVKSVGYDATELTAVDKEASA